MSAPKGAAQTDLERLFAELVSPDRSKRLAAVRRVNHAHQRPDLATVDALLEISYQLWRLAEAYEFINNVEPRRTAQWRESEIQKRAETLRKEIQAKAASERRRQEMEALDAQMEKLKDNLLMCSVRSYNLITDPLHGHCRTVGDVLELDGVELPGFGRVSFGDVIAALVETGIPLRQIEESNLWQTASPEWRVCALDHLDRFPRTPQQEVIQ